MGYYTVVIGDGPDQGAYRNWEAALSDARNVALMMAVDQGISRETVDTFVNGTPAPINCCWTWEAGACPDGHDGEWWPHVEWRD
jgi:hypothetical protein